MSEHTQEARQEANNRLASAVNAAYSALRQAEDIADEYGLTFSFDPSYGMGGYYEGSEGEWYASSQSC